MLGSNFSSPPMTAEKILEKLKTVDGKDSGLQSDTLRTFAPSSTGTVQTSVVLRRIDDIFTRGRFVVGDSVDLEGQKEVLHEGNMGSLIAGIQPLDVGSIAFVSAAIQDNVYREYLLRNQIVAGSDLYTLSIFDKASLKPRIIKDDGLSERPAGTWKILIGEHENTDTTADDSDFERDKQTVALAQRIA